MSNPNYTSQASISAFVAVKEIIITKYNNLELAAARLDAKYGQSQFTKKFFANPRQAMLSMLGSRHMANLSEVREMTTEELEESTYVCPISFQDYLLEVVEANF